MCNSIAFALLTFPPTPMGGGTPIVPYGIIYWGDKMKRGK